MAKIKTLKDPKEGVFYPLTSTKAVVDDNGNSVDAMITDTHTLIEDLESNTGISEYPVFDEATDYAVGDIVLYEGLMYRFVSEHAAGVWDMTQVVAWSERKEVDGKIGKLEQRTELIEDIIGVSDNNIYYESGSTTISADDKGLFIKILNFPVKAGETYNVKYTLSSGQDIKSYVKFMKGDEDYTSPAGFTVNTTEKTISISPTENATLTACYNIAQVPIEFVVTVNVTRPTDSNKIKELERNSGILKLSVFAPKNVASSLTVGQYGFNSGNGNLYYKSEATVEATIVPMMVDNVYSFEGKYYRYDGITLVEISSGGGSGATVSNNELDDNSATFSKSGTEAESFAFETKKGRLYIIKNLSGANLRLLVKDASEATTIRDFTVGIRGSYVYEATEDGAIIRTASTSTANITFSIAEMNHYYDYNNLKNGIDAAEKNIVANDILFEVGNLTNTGKEIDSISMLRSKMLFIEEGSTITIEPTYVVGLVRYGDSVGNTFNWKSEVSNASGATSLVYTFVESAYYRLVLRQSDMSESITDIDEFVNHFVFALRQNLTREIEWEHGRKALGRPIGNIVDAPYNGGEEYTTAYKDTGHLADWYQKWDDLMTEYPDNVTKEIIGMDATNHYELRAYTIRSHTDHSSNMNKNLKVVWFVSIHGSELTPAAETYTIMKSMLDKHSTDSNLAVLYDNVDWIIVTPNPYGFEHYSRYNGNKVNLNRNFPTDWQYYEKDYNDPNGGYGYDYAGESPADQIETQLIMKFIAKHQDALLMINHHSADAWSNMNKYGYIGSRFKTDCLMAQSVFKYTDSIVKSKYDWICSNVTENKTRPIFYVYPYTRHGCLDGYFNDRGVHGFIIEFQREESVGAAYPDATYQSVQDIGIIGIVNLLVNFVKNNMYIFSTNENARFDVLD